MANDATAFVAMPLSELLEQIQVMLSKTLERFDNRPMQPPKDELMTIEQACLFLHVSKVTIHKWKKKKSIFAHRIGRRIYFKKHELMEAMQSLNSKK